MATPIYNTNCLLAAIAAEAEKVEAAIPITDESDPRYDGLNSAREALHEAASYVRPQSWKGVDHLLRVIDFQTILLRDTFCGEHD